MFAEDDHGRFRCGCGNSQDVTTGQPVPRPRRIRQVNVDGMSDAEKAQIPPIHRLHAKPTAAETEVLKFIMRGPAGMDDPAYGVAVAALKKEKGQQ